MGVLLSAGSFAVCFLWWYCGYQSHLKRLVEVVEILALGVDEVSVITTVGFIYI
jgi:hypothetical protein